MSESVPESKSGSVPEAAKDPWRVAFDEFKKRDEKMVKDYREEIDTLLVFAGLFSAVLTAFVAESYQSLQEDYTKTSADLLRQISRQLANSSSPAAPDPIQFHAQRSDVRVNVCWFVSLLLSLVVALFGIFLKQWTRTYMRWTDVTPDREAVAIRHVRYRGLVTWRLEAILALLPTLLQLSVILFLSGLLVFLWNLDRMVAHVMTGLLAITFFLVATVTVLPVISRSCPFRSPLSEILAVPLWPVVFYAELLHSAVWLFISSGFTRDTSDWMMLRYRWITRSKTTLPTSWVQIDEGVIVHYRRFHHMDHVSMHIGAMVHLCRTTQSQPLWSAATSAIVTECTAYDHHDNQAFCKEIWWPVSSHIILITEEMLEQGVAFERFERASSAFGRLSSTMKDCWINFLLKSTAFACKSRSTSVAVSYMICCLASVESTTGGSCMRAFMEVLQAQYANLQESQLKCITTGIIFKDGCRDLLSEIKFVERVQAICNRSSAMLTTAVITGSHRNLLDVLVQFACDVATATTKEPHERVPEDVKTLLRALQHVDASDLLRQSSEIVSSCIPALVIVAKHEPELFPKPLARAIVHRLTPARLWNIARDVDGIDVKGIDQARITDDFSDQRSNYLWESLHARTPNATELLVSPQPLGRILNAYEEQLVQYADLFILELQQWFATPTSI